jgi:hypothetical protein
MTETQVEFQILYEKNRWIEHAVLLASLVVTMLFLALCSYIAEDDRYLVFIY